MRGFPSFHILRVGLVALTLAGCSSGGSSPSGGASPSAGSAGNVGIDSFMGDLGVRTAGISDDPASYHAEEEF